MARLRVIYDKQGNRAAEWRGDELVFATDEYLNPPVQTHFVIGDLPAYESPIDGRPIEGRAQRREDLKRNGCRPWEGREQEIKEARRRVGYIEQHLDSHATQSAMRAFHQLSPSTRRILEGR